MNKAEFKVEGHFNLTKRGMVLVGKIISGTISAQNHFTVEAHGLDLKYTIFAVEFVYTSSTEEGKIGLLISPEKNPDLNHLSYLTDQILLMSE